MRGPAGLVGVAGVEGRAEGVGDGTPNILRSWGLACAGDSPPEVGVVMGRGDLKSGQWRNSSWRTGKPQRSGKKLRLRKGQGAWGGERGAAGELCGSQEARKPPGPFRLGGPPRSGLVSPPQEAFHWGDSPTGAFVPKSPFQSTSECLG